MLRIELWVIPRIAPCRSHRAVCNTPVASCPVARDGTNASVTDGCSKNVGLRLQILRHEAPVACATAPNFLFINEAMLLSEGFHSPNDIICSLCTPGIQMVSGECLPIASTASWVQRECHIALRGKHRQIVGCLQLASQRNRTAIDKALSWSKTHITELLAREIPEKATLTRSL